MITRAILILALVGNLGVAHCAEAATIDIKQLGSHSSAILLDGVIKPGDLDQIKASLQAWKQPPPVMAIMLNSPGGDVSEAMKIADWMLGTTTRYNGQEIPLQTFVSKGQTCASACFFIFACAMIKNADVSAHIGIHSAYSPSTNSEDESSRAASVMLARVAKVCKVPDYLLGKLITTSSNETYWLTPQDLANMGAHVLDGDREVTQQTSSTTSVASPRCSEKIFNMAWGLIMSGDLIYSRRGLEMCPELCESAGRNLLNRTILVGRADWSAEVLRRCPNLRGE